MNYLYAAIALVLFGGGIYIGRLTVEVPVEKAAVKQEQAQVKQEAKQVQTDTKSEAQYVADIKTPTPLLIKQPVWLHEPTLCPSVPSTPPGGSTKPAATRAVDPGPAIDLRPQLAEFAKKYEAVIAGCREGARDWPTPR